MAKDNDNLDMQTFQIYTEEPVDTPANTKATEKAINNATKTPTKNMFSNSSESSGKNAEILKGLAAGLGMTLLYILFDIFLNK